MGLVDIEFLEKKVHYNVIDIPYIRYTVFQFCEIYFQSNELAKWVQRQLFIIAFINLDHWQEYFLQEH